MFIVILISSVTRDGCSEARLLVIIVVVKPAFYRTTEIGRLFSIEHVLHRLIVSS